MTAPCRRICVTQIPSASPADRSENIAVANEQPPSAQECPFLLQLFFWARECTIQVQQIKNSRYPAKMFVIQKKGRRYHELQTS